MRRAVLFVLDELKGSGPAGRGREAQRLATNSMTAPRRGSAQGRGERTTSNPMGCIYSGFTEVGSDAFSIGAMPEFRRCGSTRGTS